MIPRSVALAIATDGFIAPSEVVVGWCVASDVLIARVEGDDANTAECASSDALRARVEAHEELAPVVDQWCTAQDVARFAVVSESESTTVAFGLDSLVGEIAGVASSLTSVLVGADCIGGDIAPSEMIEATIEARESTELVS